MTHIISSNNGIVFQPLHLLQQLPSKLPAGAVAGIQQAPDALCLAGHIKAGLGLALGRHILIARQSGADVGAKALHFVHRSFLPGLRSGPRAGEHAGGHSVNDGHIGIHADCLTVFHFNFLLFLVIFTSYVPDSTMRQRKMKLV
nr:MAG TPA: hypothetical protein [Caudoviricetes sp.]